MKENLPSDPFTELCVRDLCGETSPEEKASLRSLLKVAENRETFERLQEVWQSARDPRAQLPFDTDRAWGKLAARIGLQEADATQDDTTTVIPFALPSRKRVHPLLRPFQKHPIFATAVAAAACFVISAASVTLIRPLPEAQTPPSLPQQILATGKAQQTRFTLPDGSQVRLNADSKLVLETHFGEDERRVSLSGEAFFEVARDTGKPFIVEANGIETRVLGTAFNVSAFPDSPQASVTLVSGKVQVRPEAEDTAEGVTLLPSQAYSYNTRTGEQTVQSVNVAKVTGWMQNRFHFDNAPLDQTLATLGRHYNVQFSLADPTLAAQRISTNVDNEPLTSVLDILERTGQLKFELHREGGRITRITVLPPR